MEIINYFVNEENFVIYYRKNGSVEMKYMELVNVYDIFSRDIDFIKRLVKYYLLSKTNDILKEEFNIFLQRLVMTSEEIAQELEVNHNIALLNKDAFIFSINRDISYKFQENWQFCYAERESIFDIVDYLKHVAEEAVAELDGMDINSFLQSLTIDPLRKGFANKVFNKVPQPHRNYLKLEYIEKSLPYLYDDLLFAESVAELYVFDRVIELGA